MLSTRPTPAMGWNSWNAYRCYDINEHVILANADALIRLGLVESGYDTVVVDDGWQAPERDGAGALRACPQRFPRGMAWLGEQLHARGLKFGLYLAPGRRTCAQYWDAYGRTTRRGAASRPRWPITLRARLGLLAPDIADVSAPPASGDLGSYRSEAADLSQLLDWGVDYLKYDWCRAELGTAYTDCREAFALMGHLIENSPREMTYSISEYGESEPWRWAGQFANSWRMTPDIAARPSAIFAIARASAAHGAATCTGHVGDADMLQVGNVALPARLRRELDRTHVLLWAMLASPLMIGTDLRQLAATDPVVAALRNPEALAVSQHADVSCAELVAQEGAVDVYERSLAGERVRLRVNTSWRRSGGLPGYGSELRRL